MEPRDWADDTAEQVIDYLIKCADRSEKRELIAAYLRTERSRGKLEGVGQLSAAFASVQRI